jgi:hypothetical protein
MGSKNNLVQQVSKLKVALGTNISQQMASSRTTGLGQVWHNRRIKLQITLQSLYLHNDIVDGDMDQFDEESNETHDQESHSDSLRNLDELCITKEQHYTKY